MPNKWPKATKVAEKERSRLRRTDPAYRIKAQLYRLAHKVELKAYMERYRYGTTSQEMIEKQKGLCAICAEPLDLGKKTHIDHKDDRIRGVLCHLCNVGLGHFRDSILFLSKAISYLEKNALKL